MSVRQRKTGFIKTYFDGTVKDLVEALSRIETQHLNLQRRRDIKRKAKVICSEISALIAAFAAICGQRGELWEERGEKQQIEWLLAPLLGHQLVDKLILWTLQGLEKRTTATP